MKNLYRLIDNYGVKGAWIYLKLKLGKTKNISLPKVAHPIRLRSTTSDIPTFKQVFIMNEYNIPLEFSPEVIIDAGANMGLTSIYYANKYPKAKIISIEPESTNFALLKENVAKYPNVSLINKALSNSSESLNIIDHGLGNWGFMTASLDEDINGSKVLNTIQTITIPEIMKENNLTYLDLVKIDIEGFEKELFESNYDEWLPHTKCLLLELHDDMKQGCSTSFFKCMSKYNFSFSMNLDTLVFVNNNLQ